MLEHAIPSPIDVYDHHIMDSGSQRTEGVEKGTQSILKYREGQLFKGYNLFINWRAV